MLKWYRRCEIVVEVKKMLREFQSDQPTQLIITRIRVKFEVNGTV